MQPIRESENSIQECRIHFRNSDLQLTKRVNHAGSRAGKPKEEDKK